jgi:hypothetical protein
VDDFVSFFQVLHSVKVSKSNEDKLWWVVQGQVLLLLALEVVAFLGKAFGTLKLPQGLPSLCDPRLLARSLPWTTLGNDMLL